MLRHLVAKHNATTTDMGGEEQPITSHFSKASAVEERVALVFCMNPTVPIRLVDDEFFVQAFGHPFGRKGLPMVIMEMANGLLLIMFPFFLTPPFE